MFSAARGRRPTLAAPAHGTLVPQPRTRTLTIVAQDPAVEGADGQILTAEVDVPAEELARGPWGYRVHVIDYDGSTRTLYKPLEYAKDRDGLPKDRFRKPSRRTILGDPRFHAQNVYAIVMRTLARFEFALGRRVSWGFRGHQLNVAPHAFADANAFYSERDQALLFGYFPGRKGTVFSCLSHDVVAHETTHALVDGLRERFTDPSSPDQAAFHEGFADLLDLLLAQIHN
jgi:Zn-dependent metalloprotease